MRLSRRRTSGLSASSYAVLPYTLRWLRSKPSDMRHLSTSALPPVAARCSAVLPHASTSHLLQRRPSLGGMVGEHAQRAVQDLRQQAAHCRNYFSKWAELQMLPHVLCLERVGRYGPMGEQALKTW